MAFVGGTTSFYVLRALLGVAEAGFFPGIIFYLTLWFPAVYRARIVGYFMAAIPLSTVIGAPVSGLLLGLDGVMGLKGWQWLFIIEAVPSLVLSVVVFYYLTDRPADATWLEPDERAWLVNRLAQERQRRETVHGISVMKALFNPKVLALSVVYFGAVATNYGLSFFLPQIVQAFGAVERADRIRLGAPVRRRPRRHGVVGAALRSQGRAAVSTRRLRFSSQPPGSGSPRRSTIRR